VQAGEPGGRCHGCGAPLSAYVLRRGNGGLKTVGHYRKFARSGRLALLEMFPQSRSAATTA